jgi:parvulin-like peptidyl-prolyl isomerase
MAEKLNFSLPQKKAGKPVWGILTVLLLIILVALAAANLAVVLSDRAGTPVAGARDLSTQQVKDLATKLAQRNLYQQAAATWRDYLTRAEPAGPERARIYFQMGTLLEKAGLYGEAIEQYYRSEAVADVGELRSELNAHVKDCFEKLGEFSALRYEVMDRTSLDSAQPAGGKVVAEIGADKITEAQLDARIEESIENQLAPMKAFMTPEQLGEQKKKALEQFRNPQAKQEFLQNWLAEEILYRQALQEDLGQKPEVKRLVHELTRGALSQQLMSEQLASKINITDTDLQTYYTANKDKYVEPTWAKISHILVNDETRANELLKRIKDGADFAAVAKEASEDKATKDNGGRIDDEVLKGTRVPGIGDANDINAAVFAATAPAVLDKAFKTDKGWEIIRVDEKQSERQKTFDEVRPQVTRELLRRKSEEVQREYIKEMMDKHKVIIHTSALAPAPQETTEKAPAKQ